MKRNKNLGIVVLTFWSAISQSANGGTKNGREPSASKGKKVSYKR